MTIKIPAEKLTEEQRENFRVMEEHKRYLEEAMPTIQRIQANRSTKHIAEFKGSRTGKVAIIGNGASALEFKREEWPYPTIGMNLSWKLFQADYHCIIDIGQFRRINSLPELQRPSFRHLFIGVYWDLRYPLWKFWRWDWMRKLMLGRDWQSKYPLWRDWDYETCTEIANWPQTLLGGFSWQIEKYGAWMPSTMHMALQLALHMGFHDIRIWGLDLKGPKFNGGNEMDGETAMRQNAQFLMANMTLRQMNVSRYNLGKPPIRILNMSSDTACTAFERAA
jgi:hypothetical protein